jgi:hypothetical protein
MAEEIKINIGADSSKLQAELQKAENELKQFQAALKKTTDVAEIQKLQTNVKGLETQIGSLRGGMQKLTPASNTATQSLTNLSRVAQDAPFGFIGIANNLNPLFESFTRLRSETGSTGGALKALVSSLGGAGGIGLALGLVTSALQFAAVGFTAWIGKTKEAKEAADETKKALNSIYNEQGKEATQVVSLIAILNNETETRKRKLDALNELKKINPQIFSGLKLEQGAVEGLDAAYSAYIANLKNVVAAKIIQQRLEKELAKLVELEGKTQTKSEKQRAELAKNFAKQRTNDLRKLGAEGANFANQIEEQNNALIAQKDAIKNSQIALANLTIKELTSDLTALSNGIKLTGNESKKATKEIETIDGVLKELQNNLANAIQVGIALKTPKAEVVKEEIKLIEGAIQKLISDLNVAPDDQIIKGLKAQINLLGNEFNKLPAEKIFSSTNDKVIALENQLKKLQNQLKTTFTPEGISNLKTQIGTIEQEITKLGGRGLFNIKILPKIEIPDIDLTKLVELSEGLNKFFKDTFNGVSVAIGDALGAALSGENIGSFFDNIFKIIGTGLQELGKYFIASAELIKLIKESLALKPGAALIAGIALVALGSFIANQASKKQAFAVGTRNAPGGVALIGERGPELVSLPGGSQVVPAAQTAAMMGGVGGSIEVFGMLRGQDIYFSNKKYGQTYGRTT